MEDIKIFHSKHRIYKIKKENLWKFFTFLVVSIIPLIFSILKFTNIKISFIISIIFFVIVFIMAWIVFVEKIEII